MPEPVKPRGRPPSERARAAILRATRELLEAGGVTAVTMEGVALRAKVGKPTVYRHWANRHELAMAALLDGEAPPDAPGRGSPLARLRAQLRQMGALFASGLGRNVTALLAASYGETELSKAFRSHFVQARRDEGRALLGQAIAAGEVRADIDLEVALDLIYGPIFYRLTMGHGPLDRAFADAILGQLTRGIGR